MVMALTVVVNTCRVRIELPLTRSKSIIVVDLLFLYAIIIVCAASPSQR